MPNNLEIKYFGCDVLTQKAEPITEITPEITQLIEDMFHTMYEADGCGLAAPQVGVSKRLFVCDISKDEDKQPMVFINPEFISFDGEQVREEGCLSFPNIFENVKRFETVVVKYKNELFEECQIEATELLSVVVQHENDHLNGVLLTDKIHQLRRMANGFRLNKIRSIAQAMSNEVVVIPDDE